jgi:hypothetical protein
MHTSVTPDLALVTTLPRNPRMPRSADGDSKGDVVADWSPAWTLPYVKPQTEVAVEFAGDMSACASANLIVALALCGHFACNRGYLDSTANGSRRCHASVEAARRPRTPWQVGVARLGSAVLRRSGADARIVSMVNPDGFE